MCINDDVLQLNFICALSKMGFSTTHRFWSLVFFSCFAFSLGNDPKTFIVRVQSDEKPAVFPTLEHWYSSTLRSVSAEKPTKETEAAVVDEFIYVYKTVFHGFSAKLSDDEAEKMKKQPGVLCVLPDQLQEIHTTRSPQFLGLTSNKLGLLAGSDYGSNIVIGVFDTGIWPERRSFRDRNLGPVPTHWKGECEEGQAFSKSACNKKLVGARFFNKGYEASVGPINETTEYISPRDSIGHGTHTASTAAGRKIRRASMMGYAEGVAAGMAPKARIAVYKICWYKRCANSDILSAFDKAVEDGVDIISLSVGRGTHIYFLDPISVGAFAAMEKGIFVSASAGNGGPDSTTVGNISPWITTVGASTIDRTFPTDILFEDGHVITGASVYWGTHLPVNQFFPLIYGSNASSDSGEFSAGYCLDDSLDPNAVRGKIVLCDQGGNSRLEKGAVVKKAGGFGMIITNGVEEGEGLIAEPHVLPAVLVGLTAANALHAYVNSVKNPRATIVSRGTQLGVKPAPVVAWFSSRGPSGIIPEIIKPDVIAPGVNILAAWVDGVGPTELPSDTGRTEFNIISGTSMACPHVSGLAALLKGAHPDWSPAGIRSALMTSAYTVDNTGKTLLDGYSGNSSIGFDFGSGHVDPEKAMNPGLIYDLRVEDYETFLCNAKLSSVEILAITRRKVRCAKKRGNPAELNYPSVSAVFDLKTKARSFSVTVNRTVTNVGLGSSSYTVTVKPPRGASVTIEPKKLDFNLKNQKLKYRVRIKAGKVKLLPGKEKTEFGKLTWSDGKHVVNSPIAVTWRQPIPI